MSCNSCNIYKPVEEIQFFFPFCSYLFITLNVKSPSIKHNYTDKLEELVSHSKLPSSLVPNQLRGSRKQEHSFLGGDGKDSNVNGEKR